MGTTNNQPSPPEMNPYIFTLLLFFFGVWSFYDGWITTDTKMLEHALLNKVVSGILLPWSIYDFYKVKKYYRKDKKNKDE